jgi:hypothetical protein
LSTLDANVMGLATGVSKKYREPKKYNISLVRRPDDAPQAMSPALATDPDPPRTQQLKALLRNSDPLPKFLIIPTITSTQFVSDFFVTRGPRSGLVARSKALEAIDDCSEDSLIDLMQSVTFRPARDLAMLGSYTSLAKKLTALADLTQQVRLQVQRAFESLLIHELYHVDITPSRDARGYSDDPSSLLDECKAKASEIAGKGGSLHFAPEIVHAVLSVGFDVFSDLRPALAKADSSVESWIADHEDEIVSDWVGQLGSWQEVLGGVVWGLRENNGVTETILGAAKEQNPIRKLERFDQGLRKARDVVQEAVAALLEIKQENLKPLFAAVIVVVRPPGLVSNTVFLREFCAVEQLKEVFGRCAINPIEVIEEVLTKDKGFRLSEFLRTRTRSRTTVEKKGFVPGK